MEELIARFIDYLANNGEYSQNTFKAYESDLKRFVVYLRKKLGREISAADLIGQNIAEFLQAESTKGRKTSTLLRRQASLRRFARYLKAQALIPELPETEVDFLKQTRNGDQPVEQECLTEEEIELVRQAMAETTHPRALRDLAIFALLLETGISISKLVELNLSDLDLRAQRVRFEAKRGIDEWVPINGVTDVLEQYVFEGRSDLSHPAGQKALFVSQMGGRMSRQGIWQVLRNWGNQVNISRELSPRLIRRTAAARMIDKELPLKEIQRSLGHRNVLSTRALMRRMRDTNGKGENSNE
ncbi:MAG: tyrosine-type recombinase/integrase [Anaerolineales bacterium]|nr:tyrosine-type recombinase/integrase [Anaerolineales bacterium]